MSDLDYARFGRQIALPTVGADGQRALARVEVRFTPAFGADEIAARSEQLHARAGGVTGERAEIVLRVPTAKTASGRLGVAAAMAVEAGRRVLGQPARELPHELIAHLDELDADTT